MPTAQAQIPKSFTKACEQILAKGFTHIKVELEAGLGRGRSGEACTECRGRGHISCMSCERRGYTLDQNNNPFECTSCAGDGSTECRRCNGRGHQQGGYTDSWCRDQILYMLRHDTARDLVYSEFYWDGSVDSEYTFTLPITSAHKVIDVIKAFNRLGDELIGRGVSTNNAGLHICVLPEGSYPCTPGLLNQSHMRNFRREVSKLLPALYFLGTHRGQTRGLDFRKPFVSESEKYSAIFTHGDTAIEYRVFDPCFDKPEAFFDKVEVIANTLKYYSDETAKPKYDKFNMYELNELSRLYGTTENYEALMATIKDIKPDKTLSSIRAERYFTINKTVINRQLKAEKSRWIKDEEQRYLQFKRDIQASHNWILTQYLRIPTSNRAIGSMSVAEMYRYQRENSLTDSTIRRHSEVREQIILAKPGMFGVYKPKKQTFKQYLASHARRAPYELTCERPLDEESSEDED